MAISVFVPMGLFFSILGQILQPISCGWTESEACAAMCRPLCTAPSEYVPCKPCDKAVADAEAQACEAKKSEELQRQRLDAVRACVKKRAPATEKKCF